MRFILASGSPRRRALLEAAGFDFDVEESGVEETLRAGEPAEAFAQRVAREKALCVVRPGRVRARCHSEPFACRTERSEGPGGPLRVNSAMNLALVWLLMYFASRPHLPCHPSLRSFQSRFADSIRAIFLFRTQPLTCFSRAITAGWRRPSGLRDWITGAKTYTVRNHEAASLLRFRPVAVYYFEHLPPRTAFFELAVLSDIRGGSGRRPTGV